MDEELYPFRERNLSRVEDGSGKRIELPAACLAFPDCKASLLVEPVSSDFLRSTERTFLDDDGIYEINFFFRWFPMFGIIPFRDGRDHQVSRHKSIGKFAPEGFFLSFVHVWRFRPLASVFPKPPSFKKDNARQKALSIKLRHSLVWRQYYTDSDADLSLTCTREFKMKIDATLIFLTFTKFIYRMWEKHPRIFFYIAKKADPAFISRGLLLDQAYEEEFSQIILPYNTKEYTIEQAKEILMKYASIYPVIVKHMEEYKKMVDNDLESTISEIQSSNLYKEKKLYEKELYGDFCEKNRTNKTTIDALSIYMAFTTFMIEIWKSHKKTFWQIPSETDPSQIKGQISVDAAYEEEFSQIILPYNTKEYTIDQAKEILMKYASIYPEVVKHLKEYKKMVDNDLESTISEIQSSNLYKEKKPYEKELYGDFN